MALTYAQLAQKLQLLARPRIRVRATQEALQVELLAPNDPEVALVGYDFTYDGSAAEASPAKVMAVMSAFLETAATMLANLPDPFSATSFAQELYNAGFWTNPAGGETILNCELVTLEYRPEYWVAE